MTLTAPPGVVPGVLDPMFRPRGIAVVGASADPAKLGSVLLRSLRTFDGHVAAVNPTAAGMYPSIAAAAAAGPIDLAVVCSPGGTSPQVLAEAAAAGVPAALICGGGFAEAGPDGAQLQARLSAIAAGTGIRVLGPNTSGFLAPAAGLYASFVPGAAAVPAGRVAVVAASGGVNHVLAFLLAEAGYGVSLAVGIGNGVDVTAPDVLEFLASDPDTTAVALHVESVPDGPRLIDAVRRLSATRAVVALVVGRHDVAEFAASHTGALATSWRTTRAALAQAGAVLVADERELAEAAGALSVRRGRPAATPGVGVVTAQAGPGLLLLDDLTGRRIEVPALAPATRAALGAVLPPLTYQGNPVDTGRPTDRFGEVVEAVATDPAVHIVAGYSLDEPDAVDLVAALTRYGRGEPVVFGVGGTGAAARDTRARLIAAGIPAVDSPRALGAVVAALVADARIRHRARSVPNRRPGPPVELPDGPLDEHAAKSLLGAIGIPTMPRRVVADRTGARRALAELGPAVAVKLLDADVLHKTEIGGVHLGISTAEQLEAAVDRLEAIGARRLLVESMAPAGVDLILGARRDPVFGPIVLLGLGGTAAEALGDVAVRPAPLTVAEAAEMPHELLGAALLQGWRGGPELDPVSLAEAVVALGELLVGRPRLTEIEINPLRVLGDGIVALDCVALIREDTDGHAYRR